MVESWIGVVWVSHRGGWGKEMIVQFLSVRELRIHNLAQGREACE